MATELPSGQDKISDLVRLDTISDMVQLPFT